MEYSGSEILVLPFYGQGHLFPSMELCIHFSSRNYSPTLIIPSYLSSSIPDSLRHHPFIQILQIAVDKSESPPPAEQAAGGRFQHQHQQLGQGIERLLSARSGDTNQTRPVCVVFDVMMSWSKEIFAKFGFPAISFFTSGACSAAMVYAGWKARVDEMKPGDIRVLPGLPQDMALAYSDLDRRPPRHGGGGGNGSPLGPPNGDRLNGPPSRGMGFGPPGPGQKPRWLDEVEGSVALLINTCDDLEKSFINYVATQIGKPVWGVGPLLPEKYWKSAGSLLRDGEIRSSGRQSSYTEDEVTQWLDSKSCGSVIYISFGSEVGPTVEEYEQLANALGELNQPFIWVLQPNSGKPGPPSTLFGVQTGPDVVAEGGYYPHSLDKKVGNRGLIIRGWAPQLLILSHPSTGGFLSHCGWNSTVEAIGRGVPILAWPIRGDQYYNAKLVVSHLKVGCMVSSGGDSAKGMKKEDIIQGIERLMGDEEVHKRARILQGKLESGFPASSVAALDALVDFIK